MFSKRQNRSVHDTSYTGVNPAASRASQPDNNALAAALSIGKSLKQQGNLTGYEANGNQHLVKPPQKHSSLLKRDSITRSPGSSKFRNFSDVSYNSTNSIQTPPHSEQRRSSIQRPSKVGYDVDDSFDDSYFDDVNQDTTQHYNSAKMRDLRLTHQLSPPPSRDGQLNQGRGATGTVKMVKKYIPTPNGIKIIEVPETVYQKEVARNNSMRSMPRSGSMSSLSQKRIPRTTSLSSIASANKKSSHQRLSSLVRNPTLGTMSENEEFQSTKRRDNDPELQKLQQQIDHEKQISKDLEIKRLEYEKIKLQRLENEKKILLLEKEAAKNKDIDVVGANDTKEEEEEDVPISNLLVIVDEVENKRLGQQEGLDTSKSVIEKPSLGEINDTSRDDINASVDEMSVYENEAIPEASIDASSVVVDEFEKKSIQGDEPTSVIDSSEQLQNGFKSDRGATELNVISQYAESKEGLNRDSIIDNPIPVSTDEEDDFGIEEVPYNKSDEGNLAKQLRPTFDSQSEIIDTDSTGPTFDPHPEIINSDDTVQIEEPPNDEIDVEPRVEHSIKTLQIPISSRNDDSASSSVHSSNSFDSNMLSKAGKRPVKSAMKTSSSFYNSSNNSSTMRNAAQDAYLSLATAENTRLNSKLSSAQLNDAGPQFNGNSNQIQAPVHANSHHQENQPQPKRMSTLRKSPSTQSTGLASRSLRPQSTLPETLPQSNQHQTPGNGIGNRKLRDRKSAQANPGRDRASYVNPIGAHPALQPNYQSPSKARAAELYAKAKARPNSSFTPIAGKNVNDGTVTTQQIKQPHRTTLRDTKSSSQTQKAENSMNTPPQSTKDTTSSPAENNRGFKSRLADSDDEEDHEGRSKFFGGGFSSRFNDSDEEVGGSDRGQNSQNNVGRVSSHQPLKKNETTPTNAMANGQNHSMRDKTDQSLKSKPKEKRKFAKLRKLFGKD